MLRTDVPPSLSARQLYFLFQLTEEFSEVNTEFEFDEDITETGTVTERRYN